MTLWSPWIPTRDEQDRGGWRRLPPPDVDLNRRSLHELAAFGARNVLPGHDRPWLEGTASAVRLAHHAAYPLLAPSSGRASSSGHLHDDDDQDDDDQHADDGADDSAVHESLPSSGPRLSPEAPVVTCDLPPDPCPQTSLGCARRLGPGPPAPDRWCRTSSAGSPSRWFRQPLGSASYRTLTRSSFPPDR